MKQYIYCDQVISMLHNASSVNLSQQCQNHLQDLVSKTKNLIILFSFKFNELFATYLVQLLQQAVGRPLKQYYKRISSVSKQKILILKVALQFKSKNHLQARLLRQMEFIQRLLLKQNITLFKMHSIYALNAIKFVRIYYQRKMCS
ncbi:Hypothetical_protein [Hexamita inflata]|uniref:Hypothetical_protein n=1 Tax=Hexamita inflata TaxID=28002 RepID=A0AA86TPW6_9EUKA|nr:Hypothetical protein HINF_LOCUS12794 [Hexamita inflata]